MTAPRTAGSPVLRAALARALTATVKIEAYREGPFAAHGLSPADNDRIAAILLEEMRSDPTVVEAFATALRQDATVKAITGRLGQFNDVWWDRWAGELVAALLGDGS